MWGGVTISVCSTRLLHVAGVCLHGLGTWLSREPAGCRLTFLWVDDEGAIENKEYHMNVYYYLN